jgi:3-phenylpropionate/trans-cinnamate dioxygenase ferredoxin reductase subunit
VTAEAPARIVIIGAGQAGGWAAKTLRDEGFEGDITLVGAEPHPPHARPPLSKAVLAGTADPAVTHLFKPALFQGLRVDWRARAEAVSIDRARRKVDLRDGQAVPYDRLLVCTGGHARTLDVAGAREAGVFTLRSIDDAIALRAALQPGRALLVIGGGWIGLEVAATARKLRLEVRVQEALPRLCARVLPPALSEVLRALHERNGVAVSCGTTVDRFARRSDGRVAALLADGTEAIGDVVVAGIGLVPNDALARQCGLACDRGILVDASCATSDPCVFAAGDVTVMPGGMRLESWQNAQDQGIAAARAMLGRPVRYEPLPRFWSEQHDTMIQILGLPGPDDDVVFRGDVAASRFVAFTLEGGRVRSAVAFNAARDLRAARALIEQRAIVDRAALADATQDLPKLA